MCCVYEEMSEKSRMKCERSDDKVGGGGGEEFL